MYYEVVSQCTQSLKLVEDWLDKAAKFADEKKFDVDALLNGRTAARPRSLSSLDPLKPASSHSFAPRPTTAEAVFRFAARAGSRWPETSLSGAGPQFLRDAKDGRYGSCKMQFCCNLEESCFSFSNSYSSSARRGPRPLRRSAR